MTARNNALRLSQFTKYSLAFFIAVTLLLLTNGPSEACLATTISGR